jgi:hypothetical protein
MNMQGYVPCLSNRNDIPQYHAKNNYDFQEKMSFVR